MSLNRLYVRSESDSEGRSPRTSISSGLEYCFVPQGYKARARAPAAKSDLDAVASSADEKDGSSVDEHNIEVSEDDASVGENAMQDSPVRGMQDPDYSPAPDSVSLKDRSPVPWLNQRKLGKQIVKIGRLCSREGGQRKGLSWLFAAARNVHEVPQQSYTRIAIPKHQSCTPGRDTKIYDSRDHSANWRVTDSRADTSLQDSP
ncbi:hypothetical protein WJX79_009506 [Trebouxia sp. C0005]